MAQAKVDYHEYLASREWRLKRKAVIDFEGGYCARCKSAPIESVHHLTYEALGHENPYYDLMGVCGPCHEYLAGERDDDPARVVIESIITRDGLRPEFHKDGYVVWLAGGESENGDLLLVYLVRTEDLDRWKKARVCLPFGSGITGVCWWM